MEDTHRFNNNSIRVLFGIKGHEALDRNPGPGYNTYSYN